MVDSVVSTTIIVGLLIVAMIAIIGISTIGALVAIGCGGSFEAPFP